MKYVLAVLVLLLPGIACAEEQTLTERCTSDEASSSQGEGDHKTFVFDVENKCDFEIRCELNIAQFNAFGMRTGHKIVSIAPKAHGSLTLKVKGFGGMSSRVHTCKQI